MTTNTVQSNLPTKAQPIGRLALALMMGLCLGTHLPALGSTVLGSWVPVFKGIDHAVGTNTAAGGGMPDLQVAHCMRVDLTDPDIQLFASPPIANFSLGNRETAGYTTTNFLLLNHLQLAINANGFYEAGSTSLPDYLATEGMAMDAVGLVVCQGALVSVQDSADGCGAFTFTSSNVPTFIPTNWPAASTAGVYTAVSGPYAVLVNGLNIGSNYINNPDAVHDVNPRTAMGLSQDRRYLYLLTIDGRMSGYSVGALDWETAAWLLKVGAWNGLNLDGGGSTCMAMTDSTGRAVEVNRSLVSVGWGRERTVGAHFGVYAKPVPGFINDIKVLPDDNAATVTWTTTAPATTQVKYGLTSDLPLATAVNSTLVTNHAALLTNLTAGTEYFFTVLSTAGGTQYVSALNLLVTTNYVTTNQLVDLTNAWTYTTSSLDGVKWTARTYDDSAWTGSGPGLLWVDDRGANSSIPVPMLTQMPGNPSTGYPYRTYYFRTRFTVANPAAASELAFADYIDDGAVFYLNGTEIYRLRMAAAPTVIYNTTLASGYGCSGDATCPHTFAVSGSLLTTNLVAGTNVLAVEVHNYNAGSPDITFGCAASLALPYVPSPTLNLTFKNGALTLSWDRGGFTLQQASSPAGPWTDVPGPVVNSPYTTAPSSQVVFFRLHK